MNFLEDFLVGQVVNACTLPVSLYAFAEVGNWDSALEALGLGDTVSCDRNNEPFRQGIDDADTDSVKTAGDLVGTCAELAASVEDS